jgi:rhodanese-related sulfurtransferase
MKQENGSGNCQGAEDAKMRAKMGIQVFHRKRGSCVLDTSLKYLAGLVPWRFKCTFLDERVSHQSGEVVAVRISGKSSKRHAGALLLLVLCLLGSASRAELRPEQPAVIAREAGLLADPRAVAATLGTPAAPTLIDMRAGAGHERVTIPGALPIPLHALKTKPYLRDKDLVLVGKGHEYRTVAETIGALSAQGFKQIRVLDGGLNLWRRVGYPLSGGVFDQEALQRLAPEDYLREQAVDQWVVLSVAGACRDLEQRLQAALAPRKAAGRPAVLLISPEGEDYGPALQALAGEGEINLFLLQGGQPAMKAERARSQAIAGTRHRLASTERPLACH